MKILYSWLKDFIDCKESPEKLAELLSAASFETVVEKRFGADAVFEVGLLPNRVADASSHLGIARELALLRGRKLVPAVPTPRATGADIRQLFSCGVSAQTGCRRYMLAGMTGIRVKDSPRRIKKRLLACGVRPINNVVDAANYVMLEMGQPLHAFDADRIAGKRITVRLAKKGETIETIEKKTYVLSGKEVLIADRTGPLALAGVKGGRRAEISAATKNILIESANFDPVSTRETAKRHSLKTDASWRFENDLDPNAAERALERVLALIQEVAGGTIMRGVLDYYPTHTLPRPIAVGAARISRLIGQDIPAVRIAKFVAPFCRSVKRSGGKLFLRVETYRRDVKYFEDVAEEVARLIGYNAIEAVPPAAVVIPARRNEEVAFRDRLRDECAQLAFSETYNYSFIGVEDVSRLRMPEGELVEVANPVSSEYRYLRPTLFPNLLKNVRDNLRFSSAVRLFEIGKQYRRVASGKAPEEVWVLAGMVAKRGASAHDVFLEAKGAAESLLERLGLDRDDYAFAELRTDPHLLPGASAEVTIDGKDVARIGLVRDEVLRAYNIDGVTAYWRMKIEALQRAVREAHEFEPLHKYPDVIRDVSMLLPAFTKVEDVEDVIEHAGAKYLEDTDLFDVYDEGLPDGQVSMAFHLIFRAPDRTLTDEEVGRDMEKIITALRQFGAQMR